jgi:hypothetical protein
MLSNFYFFNMYIFRYSSLLRAWRATMSCAGDCTRKGTVVISLERQPSTQLFIMAHTYPAVMHYGNYIDRTQLGPVCVFRRRDLDVET